MVLCSYREATAADTSELCLVHEAKFSVAQHAQDVGKGGLSSRVANPPACYRMEKKTLNPENRRTNRQTNRKNRGKKEEKSRGKKRRKVGEKYKVPNLFADLSSYFLDFRGFSIL